MIPITAVKPRCGLSHGLTPTVRDVISWQAQETLIPWAYLAKTLPVGNAWETTAIAALHNARTERTLAERQHRREVVERRSFHKALGDPDWIK
jgi:hypothetical protein